MKNLVPADAAAVPVQRMFWLLVVASVALIWILLPFYGPIMWGIVIALLFAPVFRRLVQRLGQRRTAAAVLTLLIVLIIVILPLALLTAALAREAAALVQRLQSGEINPVLYLHRAFDALPLWIGTVLDRIGLGDFAVLQRRIMAALGQGGKVVAAHALGIGQVTLEFIVGLFITLYLAFFLIRDGEGIARDVRRAIPMAPEHQEELVAKFTAVIRATVKGTLLVAAIQGTLGGLAFWALGVGGALLWAALMACASLIPAVGAALVWLPAALYLLGTGATWQGIALIAWGALVIGLVDNLLRPVLVGRDTRMPDYVVMIATIGGLAAFGVNGFVLGPVIAAMFLTAWHIYSVGAGTTAPVLGSGKRSSSHSQA